MVDIRYMVELQGGQTTKGLGVGGLILQTKGFC